MYFYSTGQNYVPNMKPPLGAVPNPHSSFSDGVVGDWPFWENGGTTVFDLSGNGITATFGSSAGWTSGPLGPAIQFPGDTDYLFCGSSPLLKFGLSDKSIVVYLRIDTVAALNGIIMAGGKTNADEGWHFRYDDAGNYFRLTLSNGSSRGYFDSNTGAAAIEDGNWHQVALTADRDNNANFYLDGVSIGGQSISGWQGQDIQGNNNLLFSDYISTTWDVIGAIDMPIMYNRALSASEIALLYREPFIRYRWTLPELIHYYSAPVGNAGIMTPNTGFWGPTF